MKKILMTFLMIAIINNVFASAILDREMASGTSGTIKAKVSAQISSDSNGRNFVGVSAGKPNPDITGEDWGILGDYREFAGNVKNPYSNILSLSTSFNNNDNSIKGYYPSGDDNPRVYVWFYSESSNYKLKAEISKLNCSVYSAGLDWEVKFIPQNKKAPNSVTISTKEQSLMPLIEDTKTFDNKFDSTDLEYWTVEINTVPLPPDVPGNASFSGEVKFTIEV